MEFNSYFYYDETSPSGLRWKMDRRTGRDGRILIVSAGDVAGTSTSDGYWQVGLNGITYKPHKIVWELHTGEQVKGEKIDHKDGDRLNNRIGNLRVCSHKANCRNQYLSERNTSGVVGVFLVLDSRNGSTSYRAQWNELGGKLCNKQFSTLKFGHDCAFDMACSARLQAIERLNIDGAGYTERHGKLKKGRN